MKRYCGCPGGGTRKKTVKPDAMKIAFITDHFPRISEQFIINQIIGLLQLGCDVDIYAFWQKKKEPVHEKYYAHGLDRKVTYFHMPRTKLWRYAGFPLLVLKNLCTHPRQLLDALDSGKYGKDARSLKLLFAFDRMKDSRYDVVHCHFGYNGIIGVFLKTHRIAAACVTTFHGYDINVLPQKRGGGMYQKVFDQSDLITVNTAFTKGRVVDLGGPPERVKIMPVGILLDEYLNGLDRERGGGRINILTVARLTEKKGHQYAIRAFAEVSKRRPGIHYLLAGDGPLRRELESLVAELGIETHVEFLGMVDDRTALKLYRQADIFMLASVTAQNGDMEGQGLVLQEAQLMGIPVISTLHNGIPDGVVDNRTGFLVPEKNVPLLAEKLEYLIDHPEARGEMGRRGCEFVKERYDIIRLNRQLLKYYQEILDRNRRAS